MMVLLIPSVTMVETNIGRKLIAVQKLPNLFLEVVGNHSIWSMDSIREDDSNENMTAYLFHTQIIF